MASEYTRRTGCLYRFPGTDTRGWRVTAAAVGRSLHPEHVDPVNCVAGRRRAIGSGHGRDGGGGQPYLKCWCRLDNRFIVDRL